jgi:hypothetical protein
MAKLESGKGGRKAGTSMSEAIPSFDPIVQASNTLLEGLMAVSTEILEFSKTRFDHSLEVSQAIARSTSINEAIDLQARYTREIMQDYFSEANKIVDLSTRSLLDSLSQLQHVAPSAPHHAEAAE